MLKSARTRRDFLKAAGLGLLSLPAVLASCARSVPRSEAPECLVYVGTFVLAGSESLFLYRLNMATGALTLVSALDAGGKPGFLTLDAKRQHLYTATRVDEFAGVQGGAVSAFAIDRSTGALRLLNRQSSAGVGPCYISLDHSDRCALVANYNSGSISSLPIQADGQLRSPASTDQHRGSGPNRSRQEGPHAHCIIADPSNRFAFAVDLGLDTVFAYALDAPTGMLRLRDTPAFRAQPGAGPRHLTFHPNARFAYLTNEIASTVTALAYDAAQGTFREIQTLSALPADFTATNTLADVHVAPNGRFVYVSNRGHNSVAVFAIDSKSGRLTLVQHVATQGKTPRNFGLDPAGRMLLVAHQDSDSIVVFRIDSRSGRLTPTGVSVAVPTPVCVQIVEDFTRG
ncbi:lactonase family protein [Hymenobacter sp. BT491]|uniref:lactonase family protein n=1 Tax=Hymenobacter sp. BT491 TaxID=2766779 RepID=UPI0016534A24|nr:lactonase family protein [Hymenobacter sp. BT491]MBC6989049.1 lactonase family protein [Hymenobacter sp. BT491]